MRRNRIEGEWVLLRALSIGLLGFLSACGEVGGSGQCGGAEETGACIRVESIIPEYLGQSTSNVDAVQDICEPDDPVTPEDESVIEEFTDHNAVVTISNSPLPGANVLTNPIVTLQNFSIVYTVNACPVGATCPIIDIFTVAPGQTVTIGPGSSAEISLPFVQLQHKFEYVLDGGSINAYPSYSANYTISGTDTFNNAVSVQGHAEFTIGDYDNCP